ncbi:gata-type transcription factor srea [Anaeramoeba flamelloides]|uniref:Gata-type transcription factor srea n=1 Tax=Anaeramoeba flamelloides TaxID=1746091 RepID=A0ABQ8XS29_9EUKA|nr:gata-type transcription factor srea [Anaeramoeba flamelloides]
MSKENKCSNKYCGTTDTPIWRKIDNKLYCNACGMYSKRHNGQDRPPDQIHNKNERMIRRIITINRPQKYFKRPTKRREFYNPTKTTHTIVHFKNSTEKKNNSNTFSGLETIIEEKVQGHKREKENEKENEKGKNKEKEKEKRKEKVKEKEIEINGEIEYSDDSYEPTTLTSEDESAWEFSDKMNTVQERQQDNFANYNLRHKEKYKPKWGTKIKNNPNCNSEPLKSNRGTEASSNLIQIESDQENKNFEKNQNIFGFNISKSDNEIDEMDEMDEANETCRGQSMDMATTMDNTSFSIFDSNTSFLTTSESSISIENEIPKDFLHFASRTNRSRKRPPTKQIIYETENKSVKFKRGECVAISTDGRQEIFAIICGFYKSTKSKKVYIKVRWLLPKIHPFHPDWHRLNTKQLTKFDFRMGNFEPIYQSVGCVTRKLGFSIL